jgi:hypothetical protein
LSLQLLVHIRKERRELLLLLLLLNVQSIRFGWSIPGNNIKMFVCMNVGFVYLLQIFYKVTELLGSKMKACIQEIYPLLFESDFHMIKTGCPM